MSAGAERRSDARRSTARRNARILGAAVVLIYLGYIAWHLARVSG